jgi:Raf kinase inhibitor-like YbhB/YbcL family protein
MRRIAVLTAMCLVATVAAAGCNDDGRELRPGRPDQNQSISTTTLEPVSTDDPTVDDIGGVFDTASTSTSTSTSAGEGEGDGDGGSALGAATVTAPWRAGGDIDARYTCDDANVSPPLTWSAAPEGTVTIAISLSDDDQPLFGHWAISGIGADLVAIAEGAVPEGATVAINGSGVAGYAGPCPPTESTHQYRITVYYLRVPVDIAGAEVVDVLGELERNSIDIAETVGLYTRI